jgi:hypothetical protein
MKLRVEFIIGIFIALALGGGFYKLYKREETRKQACMNRGGVYMDFKFGYRCVKKEILINDLNN